MHCRVSYEIYRTRGSVYVTRVIDGEEHVIGRFDDRKRAENFIAFLNEIADAPRRLAMH